MRENLKYISVLKIKAFDERRFNEIVDNSLWGNAEELMSRRRGSSSDFQVRGPSLILEVFTLDSIEPSEYRDIGVGEF
jgi:hypothetical protein